MTEADTSRSNRVFLAVLYGAACHGLFAVAAIIMAASLFTGLTLSLGAAPWPSAILANAALLFQFPLVHSFLLTKTGRRLLSRLAPAPHGKTLSTTVYALIASTQLILLFTLWTPSGVVLWRAEGIGFWVMGGAFAGAWALLGKSTWDAGIGLQSGALGWLSLLRNREPVFPDLPTRGLFRFVRHPIYVSFALILWTPPVWTLDQITLAALYTVYCLAAPVAKERRFAEIYGDRFRRYRARTPYWLPFTKSTRS